MRKYRFTKRIVEIAPLVKGNLVGVREWCDGVLDYHRSMFKDTDEYTLWFPSHRGVDRWDIEYPIGHSEYISNPLPDWTEFLAKFDDGDFTVISGVELDRISELVT